MAVHSAILALGFLHGGLAQQAGTQKPEVHVSMPLIECTATSCTKKASAATMDAQWRWLHDSRPNKFQNCIKGEAPWDSSIVGTDPEKGAKNCALEGLDKQSYAGTYGVKPITGGISLQFVNGPSIGSRLYMMESEDKYKMFKLLNKEYTMDVDVSELTCGLNGAVYFVEMDEDGGKGKGGNHAGAKYGTGYCDAQCPHDLKFIEGKANLEGWHKTKVGPVGKNGACCSEMDIWEANQFATALTPHPCKTLGPLECTDDETCGWTKSDCKCCDKPDECPCCMRYKGVCDKDGCDFNSYRLGDQSFLGPGAEFTVNTLKPMTIVTQFITSDGTDTGDLSEIRRIYVQDGKEIANSATTNLAQQYTSITDEMCADQKTSFDNPDDFGPKGGLKEMGNALGRGVVLVMSLWDDALTEMVWLDSRSPDDKPASTPGVKRGPCGLHDGNPQQIRGQHGMETVKYTNIAIGPIGSTYGAAAAQAKASPDPVGTSELLGSPTVAPTRPPNWQQMQQQQQQQQQPQQVQQVQQPLQPIVQQPVQNGPMTWDQFLCVNPDIKQRLSSNAQYAQTYESAWETNPSSVTQALSSQGLTVSDQITAACAQQQQQQVLQAAAAPVAAVSSGPGSCCVAPCTQANLCTAMKGQCGAKAAGCWSPPATDFCGQSQTNCETRCGTAIWCTGGPSRLFANNTKIDLPKLNGTDSSMAIIAVCAALMAGFVAVAAVRTRRGRHPAAVDETHLFDDDSVEELETRTFA